MSVTFKIFEFSFGRSASGRAFALAFFVPLRYTKKSSNNGSIANAIRKLEQYRQSIEESLNFKIFESFNHK